MAQYFYFYLVISSLLSDYILFSLESSLFYLRFVIFSLSTWYLLENNKKFQFFSVAVEELGKKDLQLMKESKEYTRLMVENSNDIRDIKSRLNGLESVRYVTKNDG